MSIKHDLQLIKQAWIENIADYGRDTNKLFERIFRRSIRGTLDPALTGAAPPGVIAEDQPSNPINYEGANPSPSNVISASQQTTTKIATWYK